MTKLDTIETAVFNAVADTDYEDIDEMKEETLNRLSKLDVTIAVLTDLLISASDRMEIKRIKGRISESCETRQMILAKLRGINSALHEIEINIAIGHGVGKGVPENVEGYV